MTYYDYRKRSSSIIWTPEMLAETTRLRAMGEPAMVVAARIGVGYDTMRCKLMELGLNRRMDRSALSGNPYSPRIPMFDGRDGAIFLQWWESVSI